MVRKEYTKGFEGFQKSVENLYKDESTQLYIFFLADKNIDGASWCSDCYAAQPFIDQAVEQFAGSDAIFLSVEIGDKSFWKDLKNPFREDPNLKLVGIPTLIHWKRNGRLEGDQCTNMDLLAKFFSEEV